MPDVCLGMCGIGGRGHCKSLPCRSSGFRQCPPRRNTQEEYDPFPRAAELPEISKTVVLHDEPYTLLLDSPTKKMPLEFYKMQ